MAFRATSLLKAAASLGSRRSFKPVPIPKISLNKNATSKTMASATTATRQSPLDVQLTFLGTASAQPSSTRNHSSLALRLGSDVWLFDCGEGTQSRLQQSIVKMGRIEKIFITHTHGDHVFGLLPLLASILNGAGGAADGEDEPRAHIDVSNPVIEIYGPLGTRAYIRTGLKYTHTFFSTPYVVHELRLPWDPKHGDHTPLPCHSAESPNGRNIFQVDGVWENIFEDNVISVSAAPILHSVPCVGYVVNEAPIPGKIDPKKYIPELKRTNTHISAMSRLQKGESVELSDGTVLHGPPRRRGRKLVILGDTHNPAAIEPLALDADLLIHEATNAHLPNIDPGTKDDETYRSVEERTRSRGHSTPQMAGAFARRIRAKQLILNHFSARYPGNDDVDPMAKIYMDAIAGLAAREYGKEVICARDLMNVTIGVPES
ncbi:Metallo-hydrolase oxidoreductase [Mycena venus]|uniref:Metallo-hydrolase oxidoreductase n=1 Tax=Mycena venus TaxID=2733690 RepID=A0A8H6Y5N0_9AGAR|nr:Metallo-hydrolase oxidoreductase [Mycena venus]